MTLGETKLMKRNPRGRPRKHASDAARLKAWRAQQRATKSAEFPQGDFPEHHGQHGRACYLWSPPEPSGTTAPMLLELF